jgi:DNA-binding response OmpR family regulator
MKNIEILAVGTHPDIMKTVKRLLDGKQGWHSTVAASAAEALALNQQTSYDIVMVCAGLNADETQELQAHFKVPVVQHYGGGSGLLYAEVCGALKIALP